LVDLAILVGTDFNPGIHGIGPKTALKIVQKGEVERTLAEKAPDLDPKPIREFFLHPPVTSDITLTWSPPDAEGIRAMLVDEFSFSPERVNTALERLRGASGQKTLDRWF
jgi:flap endonuclease-1